MNDFIYPIDNPKLTSEYGMRKHPVLKVNRLHAGVDLVSTTLKNPVVSSSASGVVRVVKDEGNNGYGKYVIITHSIRGIKYETVYAHLDSFYVKVGQKIKQGEKIGVMGNTGTSTSPHLHFEIHKGTYNYGNGTYPTSLNPLEFININNTIEGGNNMSITISSGHWKNTGSGASGILNEVTENRRVVKRVAEILKQSKIDVTEIHDNISNNVSSNLGFLVREHNKSKRELDVSVHFNASSGTQSSGIGTEVLYVNPSLKQKAKELSSSIAVAGGFKNRGEKYRDNLGFLNGTSKPALLIEVCFVNSHEDAKLYNQNFEKICQAIAKELARFVGKTIVTSPTPATKPSNKTSKGDDDELKFSSSTLQKELDKLLGNSTSRNQIIERAIKELKYNESWRTKKDIQDGDILSMALSLAIKDSKK